MKKIIIVILLCCLVGVLHASEPQRRRKKQAEVEVEAVDLFKHKATAYIDISSKKVDVKTLKANIDKKLRVGCDTLFITIFSNTGAAIKSTTFENLAIEDGFFVKSASITPKQLSSVITKGVKTKIVVVVNLFNNNTNFSVEVGHPLFSGEGMRFIDDYMKQVFYNNNITICRINTNCTIKEQTQFLDPIIKKMRVANVNVILNKF